MDQQYKCICGKEFSSSQSFNGHKGHCKEHMQSQGKAVSLSNLRFFKGRRGKALSKKHRTSLSISLTKNPKNTGKAASEEAEILRKGKIRNSMKRHPNGGGLREGSGRGEKSWYESPIAGKIYLRSSYELRFAKILDLQKKQWSQNTEGFEYFWEGKTHRYYPDFYLHKEECFVEVKGFKTKKDEEKWKQFPFPLQIVFLEDIEKLERCVSG